MFCRYFPATYSVLVYLSQPLSELPPLSPQSLSLHPHVSSFTYLLNWTVLEIAQCHVTRMNCNCWCTLCIFESHFPSFWELLTSYGMDPKNVSFKHSFSGSSGRAPGAILSLRVHMEARSFILRHICNELPLARSIAFRPVQQHGAGLQGLFLCTGWENLAPELLPVSLSQGGNMAPQNKSAKDMHAQLSAWELLLGLPNTGSEQFTLCWAYYCLSCIVKQL